MWSCSKLTIKTLEQGVNIFKVNFEHTSRLVLVFLLLTFVKFEHVIAGWAVILEILISNLHQQLESQ